MSPRADADRGNLIAFPDGMPGFETCREFSIVSSATLDPFTILQGAGPAAPSFVAIDPHRVVDGYAVNIDARDRDRLQAPAGEPLLWLSLVSVHGDGTATVNLRAPLVISPASMRGIQLVPAESAHAIDHPLRLD
jgi:flagellar assembly factor FliW